MPSLYTTLLLGSLLASSTSATLSYSLRASWTGSNFFTGFNFITDPDPTNGFVKYVDQPTAQTNGLISTTSSQAYMGVDYTSKLASDGSQGGRQSVRLSSKAAYTMGLFIADFAHMPGGICGVWPAFWTFGPNWPNQGEIDIMEGVNSAITNLMSLHSGPNCTIAGSGETGKLLSNDCYQYSPTESGSGCGVGDTRTSSYGTQFNSNGGGVYAVQWTTAFIKVWFFSRGSIPSDITNGAPTPTTWGTPVSNFEGSCDIPSRFAQHNIILDTTFCGDYAGALFGSDANCNSKATSCNAYVAQNPGVFKDAYFLINYVSVYQTSSESNAPLQPASSLISKTSTSTTSTTSTTSNPAPTCPASNGALYTTPKSNVYKTECGTDYPGNDITSVTKQTYVGCLSLCDNYSTCALAVWRSTDGTCWLKTKLGTGYASSAMWGGIRQAATAAPTCPASNNALYTTSQKVVYKVSCGTDYPGNDITSVAGQTYTGCLSLCDTYSTCVLAIWRSTDSMCWLKKAIGTGYASSAMWGGIRQSSTSSTSSKTTTTTSSSSSSLTSVQPLLSQQALATLSNNAPGATGTTVAGVTKPATTAAVKSLSQDPAISNSTSATAAAHKARSAADELTALPVILEA